MVYVFDNGSHFGPKWAEKSGECGLEILLGKEQYWTSSNYAKKKIQPDPSAHKHDLIYIYEEDIELGLC